MDFILLAFVGFFGILSLKWPRKIPVTYFMICMSITLNIGGYFDSLQVIGPFLFQDFFFVGSFIPLIYIEKRYFDILKSDRYFKLYIKTLFILLAYQIIISLFIKSNLSAILKLDFLKGKRYLLYSFLLVYPSYIMILKYPKKILTQIVIISSIILTLYFISYFTGLNLIKTYSFERGIIQGGNTLRMGFTGYGFLFLVPGFAFIYYLVIKEKIKYKYFLFFAGIFMTLSVIITLTRQTNIRLFGGLIIILILLRKIYGSIGKGLILKIISFFIILFFFSSLLFPGYLNNLIELNLVTAQSIMDPESSQNVEQRSQYEFVAQWPVFEDNFAFGSGFKDFWLKGDQYNVTDIPLLSSLAIYGIFGFSIYLAGYVIAWKRIKIFFKYTRLKFLNHADVYDIIWAISLISVFYADIFLSFFNFSKNLVYEPAKIYSVFTFGLLFGILKRIELKTTVDE